MPIFNVDGVALIESEWEKHKKIVPVRKNRNDKYACAESKKEDVGVDLNRNFGVDFGQYEDVNKYLMSKEEFAKIQSPVNNPCSEFFPGP
jgi:hypothetical protein